MILDPSQAGWLRGPWQKAVLQVNGESQRNGDGLEGKAKRVVGRKEGDLVFTKRWSL